MGTNESSTFAAIDEKIRTNTLAVIQESRRSGAPTRAAAIAFGDDQSPKRETRAVKTAPNPSEPLRLVRRPRCQSLARAKARSLVPGLVPLA